MLNIYADDMLIAGVPYDDMIVPSSLPPNVRMYHSSVSSTDYPPWSSLLLHRTNCKNCGAPLPKHGKCMYCDTENGVIAKEEKNLRSSTGSLRSSMSITAEGITVTCSEIPGEPFKQEIAIRDEKGRLHRREVDLR